VEAGGVGTFQLTENTQLIEKPDVLDIVLCPALGGYCHTAATRKKSLAFK
jgi:hypothetical protein